LTENDAEKGDLAAKPKYLYDQPKDEIRLETHFANERIAQHDPPNLKVAPHPRMLSDSARH
jgi:hypothetical protein